MNRKELMKMVGKPLMEDSVGMAGNPVMEEPVEIVTTGLKKIQTIERRENGKPLSVISNQEFLDFVSDRGCGRIEIQRLPVTDDMMIVHSPADAIAICRCGAVIHRENLVRCLSCSEALCNRHRHRVSDGEYLCRKHYIVWIIKKILGI